MSETHDPTRATPARRPLKWLRTGMMAAVAAVLTACQIAPQSPSIGTTPADKASPGYRKQAAQHLYERNSGRIYQVTYERPWPGPGAAARILRVAASSKVISISSMALLLFG